MDNRGVAPGQVVSAAMTGKAAVARVNARRGKVSMDDGTPESIGMRKLMEHKVRRWGSRRGVVRGGVEWGGHRVECFPLLTTVKWRHKLSTTGTTVKEHPTQIPKHFVASKGRVIGDTHNKQ